jgi:hypothetical protein
VIVVKLKALKLNADSTAEGTLSINSNIAGFPSYAENLVIPMDKNTTTTTPQMIKDLRFALTSLLKMFISAPPYTEWISLLA